MSSKINYTSGLVTNEICETDTTQATALFRLGKDHRLKLAGLFRRPFALVNKLNCCFSRVSASVVEASFDILCG